MATEAEVDVAANAMFKAEQAARSPHGLTKGDCRVLARLALEAAEDARTYRESVDSLNKTTDAQIDAALGRVVSAPV